MELMEEKEVVEGEEEEEEVVKVEREVDVEKSNIRAMNVVCSLCMCQLRRIFIRKLLPGRYPRNAANDEGSPTVCVYYLTVFRPVPVVRFYLHCW